MAMSLDTCACDVIMRMMTCTFTHSMHMHDTLCRARQRTTQPTAACRHLLEIENFQTASPRLQIKAAQLEAGDV